MNKYKTKRVAKGATAIESTPDESLAANQIAAPEPVARALLELGAGAQLPVSPSTDRDDPTSELGVVGTPGFYGTESGVDDGVEDAVLRYVGSSGPSASVTSTDDASSHWTKYLSDDIAEPAGFFGTKRVVDPALAHLEGFQPGQTSQQHLSQGLNQNLGGDLSQSGLRHGLGDNVAQLRSRIDLDRQIVDGRLESRLESRIDSRLESRLESPLNDRLHAHSPLGDQLQSPLDSDLDVNPPLSNLGSIGLESLPRQQRPLMPLRASTSTSTAPSRRTTSSDSTSSSSSTSSTTKANGPNWEPGTVNGGFDRDEVELLDRFLEAYCTRHKLGRQQLCERVWSRDRKKDTFWDDIAAVLPERTRASVYKHVRRAYHVFSERGKWGEDDDRQLSELVASKGAQWKEIGAIMLRMPEDCRDRWRNYVKCGHLRNENKWTEKEETDLREIMDTLSREHPNKPVNWTLVSERMGGTRSRIQCRYKWRKLLRRDSIASIPKPSTRGKRRKPVSV